MLVRFRCRHFFFSYSKSHLLSYLCIVGPENGCCEVNEPGAETQSCYSQSDPKEKPNENHVEFGEFHAFDVALDYVAVDARLVSNL